MAILKLILFALNYAVLVNSLNEMQCRDESGNVVDWYVVYKFPKVSGMGPPLNTGSRYAYITSKTTNGFVLSSHNINDKESIFNQTLKPLHSLINNAEISYIVYNDQANYYASYAHAKGLVTSNKTHGFWLIHSVPYFTNFEKAPKFEYPSSGLMYGQTALCISLKIDQIPIIMENLILMKANIIAEKFNRYLTNAKKQVDRIKDHLIQENSMRQYVTSTGGMQFTTFVKSPEYNVDLYQEIVAKILNTGLYVETWRRSPFLESYCAIPIIENVFNMTLKFQDSTLTGSFKYTNDHSKWAISRNQSLPYVCIGDINRMPSQFSRGGGTTCFKTTQVWNSLKTWINNVESCH